MKCCNCVVNSVTRQTREKDICVCLSPVDFPSTCEKWDREVIYNKMRRVPGKDAGEISHWGGSVLNANRY